MVNRTDFEPIIIDDFNHDPINQEKVQSYPPELVGRFNSFIVTAFDDSMTVEMQLRTLIKWIKENIDVTMSALDNMEAFKQDSIAFQNHVKDTLVNLINNFTDKFDDNLQFEMQEILKQWDDEGYLQSLINEYTNERIDEVETEMGNARGGKDTLGQRLDESDDKLLNINNEVINARGGKDTLGQRLDESDDKLLNINNEVINARGGKDTLGQRLDETTSKLAQTDKDIKDRGINLNTSFPIKPPENSDSPRIQRAIDSLGMNGGLLFFPEGIYELSEPIIFDARNLMLTGMGRKSVLRPSDSFTGNSLIRSIHATDRSRIEALENIIIERLTFDGRQKDIIGILITGLTRGSSIRDNTFNNFEGSSIHLSGSWSYSIERNNITGSNKKGIGLDLGNGGYGGYDNSEVVNQSRIVGNTIRGHDIGILLDYGNNNLILGNTVELNNINLKSLASKGLNIIGNYFEANTSNSIRLGGVTASVKDSIIQGNFFFHGEGSTGEINIIGLIDSIITNNQYKLNTTNQIVIPTNNRGVIKGNVIESGKSFGLNYITNENVLINKDTNTINSLDITKIKNVITSSLKVDLTSVRSLETFTNGLKIIGTSPVIELGGIPATGQTGSTGEIRMVSEDGQTLARLGKLKSDSNTFSMFLDGGLDKFLFSNTLQVNGRVGFNGVEPKNKRTITGSTDSEKIASIIQALRDVGLAE